MRLEKIYCLPIFSNLKSKYLCKHNIHNYRLERGAEPIIEEYEEDGMKKSRFVNYVSYHYYKCIKCGKVKYDLRNPGGE